MRLWKVVSLMAVAAVALAAGGPPSAHEHVPTPQEISVLDEGCPSDCGLCIPTTSHRVSSGGEKDAGAGNHDCWGNGLACDYHDCAVTQGPPVETIYRMIATDNLIDLRAMVPDRNLVYVEERGALQVVADCGSIIAQLPVSRREAAELRLD